MSGSDDRTKFCLSASRTAQWEPWRFVVFVQRFLRWAVWSFLDMPT